MGIRTEDLIGISDHDSRLPFEVVSDFECFIIEALDGDARNPDRERGRVPWMMAEGRIDYSKLSQEFLEKVVACASLQERRVLLRELSDEWDLAQARAAMYRKEARLSDAECTSERSVLMRAQAEEFEARALALDPIDRILSTYFYASDSVYRERMKATLSRLCEADGLEPDLRGLTQDALALKRRLDAYEAIGAEGLFEDVDEYARSDEDAAAHTMLLEAAQSALKRFRPAP